MGKTLSQISPRIEYRVLKEFYLVGGKITQRCKKRPSKVSVGKPVSEGTLFKVGQPYVDYKPLSPGTKQLLKDKFLEEK